jgi:ubiquinone/menaquinone biosynthesis C-methylase UbiE
LGFIYHYPGELDKATYDLENQIADPEQRIERFMESLRPLTGVTLADIGAGGGYHACRFAQKATRVFAVEPAAKMLEQLYQRVAASGLSNISVVSGEAGDLPLRNELVDVVHSRFAYFFGPESGAVRSCEPGIHEALRILKPGGYFFIIDNALTTGQFAGLLARYGYTRGKAADMQQRSDEFFAGHGFKRSTVESSWSAPDRAALGKVLTMEFPGQDIDAMMGEVKGAELSYDYKVYYRLK